MSVQGTTFAADPPNPQLAETETEETQPIRRPPKTVATEEPDTAVEADRVELSARAVRKIFVGRLRRIVQSVLQNAESVEDQADKALREEYRQALRALKRAGLLDKNEVKELRKALKEARSTLEAPETQTEPDLRIEATRETRVSESRSYALEIQTADGDAVTIQLAREDQVQYVARFTAEGGQSELTTQLAASSASALTFRVEGELDEEESEAIRELVGRVDELAARFFQGDVQAALDHALELGFQDPEIAAFSLELGYSSEIYAATSYRAIQALAPAEDDSDPAPALELRDDVNQLASQASFETLFVDARALVLDFFEGALRTDPRIDAENEGRDLLSLAERLIEALRNEPVEGAENAEDDD